MAQFEIVDGVLKKCKPDRGETEIVIPDGVTKIANGLFKGKKSIVKVTLPMSLTEIGEQAFRDCIALEECDLPESLNEIGNSAFAGCTALKAISLPQHMPHIVSKCFSGCTGLTEAVIPSGWDKVPHYFFDGCTNLRKVTIPEGVKMIDGGAFGGCSALCEISLPESLEKIGSGVFTDSGVREIRIPAGTYEVWYSTFQNASNLKKIEYAVFPKQGTKLFEHLQKMLKQYPELADAVAAADNVPEDFRRYLNWIKNGSVFPREEDLLWPEKVIDKLKYDDYILIMNTCQCIAMNIYHVIGNEYTDSNDESYNCVPAKPLYYEWDEYFRWMMVNDHIFRAYRYEHGKLVETRDIDKKRYDQNIYIGCQIEMILRQEFGLEPQSPEWKAKFAAELAKAEEFKQTLVYACYVNDTPAILARAKHAKKADLNFVFEHVHATPLILCARNDNLEGFRALAEAGADLKKSVRNWIRPLEEARVHSPAILRYVFETYPDVFDSWYGNWKNDAFYCSDGELIEDMFRRYGAQGLEECYFTAMVKPPVSMDTLKFLTSHHVDCSSYLSKYHKCSAVEFAEKKCGEYPDDDGYKAALELLKQAMLTDRA